MNRIQIGTFIILGIALLSYPTKSRAMPSGISNRQTISVDGVARTYNLHIPASYDGSRAASFVLALHPMGGSGSSAEAFSGWDKIADENGIIVAYPDALGQTPAWHVGYASMPGMGDDLAFLRMLVARIQSSYKIDEQRIYVTGFSSGAMMAYELGAMMPGKFAAIAPVSGAIGPADQGAFAPYMPTQPISVIAFHGMKDRIVPYSGGWAVPTPDAIKLWAQADGCRLSPNIGPSSDSDVQITDYVGGKDNTEVQLYSLTNGRHAYPPYATAIIWQFFSTHPRSV